MKKTISINLLGGSGLGKSTTSYYIIYKLKTLNYKAEYISEFAKKLTYEKSYEKLKDQIYIFGKQENLMFNIRNEVDIIVTDSPLLISLNHTSKDLEPYLKPLVLHEYNKYININILLERTVEYETYGRNETKEQAVELDNKMKKLLEDNKLEYITLDPKQIETKFDFILTEVKKYLK